MASLTEKTEFIGFRVSAAVKTALEKAAVADSRSLSSLLDKIVADWLRNRGRDRLHEVRTRASNT